MKYTIANGILRLNGFVFEFIHRTSWKPFWHRYTPKKWQRAKLKNRLDDLLDFPDTFSIEITNVCNAKCWFCPQPLSRRRKGYMDFSLYQKIMDEISLHSRKVKAIALFMDGEPTLHKELIRFLKYAHELRINNINISSNMEFFVPELADNILNANLGKTLQYIICSLDGADRKTHSENRIGVDFSKVIYNTEYLIKQRSLKKQLYPRVFTRLLISDLTKYSVSEFKKYWRGKADKALCSKMHNWGGQVTDNRLNIGEGHADFMPCYFPFSQFAVQYDGIVRLCCIDANTSVIIGNLKEQSIREIWNNNIINEIREHHLNRELDRIPALCKDCSYPKKGTWIAPFYWG